MWTYDAALSILLLPIFGSYLVLLLVEFEALYCDFCMKFHRFTANFLVQCAYTLNISKNFDD